MFKFDPHKTLWIILVSEELEIIFIETSNFYACASMPVHMNMNY